MKFKKLITRNVKYPHGVILRQNVIVLVSDRKWRLSGYSEQFKGWYDWKLIIVPGHGTCELAGSGHIENDGQEI